MFGRWWCFYENVVFVSRIFVGGFVSIVYLVGLFLSLECEVFKIIREVRWFFC